MLGSTRQSVSQDTTTELRSVAPDRKRRREWLFATTTTLTQITHKRKQENVEDCWKLFELMMKEKTEFTLIAIRP